jgi:hypothetical protein
VWQALLINSSEISLHLESDIIVPIVETGYIIPSIGSPVDEKLRVQGDNPYDSSRDRRSQVNRINANSHKTIQIVM